MSADNTPNPAKRKKRRLPVLNLTPADREQVARWIEANGASRDKSVIGAVQWLKDHPDDYATKRQLEYDRNFQSTAKQLAYLIRHDSGRGE
jgi:hypothetical protein